MEQKLQINWEIPDVRDETGEYFENQSTKDWLEKKDIAFENEAELVKILEEGNLEEINQKQLEKSENITYKPEDFEKELEEEDYRNSFKEMENTLIADGEIDLPAPIILYIDNMYYGFAGNRRMNLAFKYALPLKAWLVRIKKDA